MTCVTCSMWNPGGGISGDGEKGTHAHREVITPSHWP
jgi:hypothetical protein